MRLQTAGLLALLLAGCTPTPVTPTQHGLDWANAPVARLRIAVGFFHPGRIDLQLGQPVRLVFDNGGGITHDFVTAFFTTVAQRPAGHRQDSQNAGPQLLDKGVGGIRVILQPAESVEYDIVPLKAGTYTVSTIMLVGPGGVPPAAIVVHP